MDDYCKTNTDIQKQEVEKLNHLTHRILETTPVRLLIYASVLKDFTVTGELDYFGTRISLDISQRLRCLKNLERMKDSLNLNPKVLEYGSKLGEIVDFAIRDDTGMITNVIEKGKEFSVQMKVRFQADVNDPIFAFTLKDLKGTEITGTNTMYEHTPVKPQKAGDVREITFKQIMPLEAGEYMLCLGCTGYKDGDFTVFHRLYDVCNLTVITDKKAVGYFDMFSKVSVK